MQRRSERRSPRGPRGGPEPREHTPRATPARENRILQYPFLENADKILDPVDRELERIFAAAFGDDIAAAAAFLRADKGRGQNKPPFSAVSWTQRGEMPRTAVG